MGRRADDAAGGGGVGAAGAEAGRGTRAYFERLVAGAAPRRAPPLAGARAIRYEVMNTVPEHWIPFVPVHVRGRDREIQLQRAALPRVLEGDLRPPRKVRPRTSLLRVGLDAEPARALLPPRRGGPARRRPVVTLGYQRTRWLDGRAVVWLGARKETGRGEGSSGLAFDRLIDQPDSGAG